MNAPYRYDVRFFIGSNNDLANSVIGYDNTVADSRIQIGLICCRIPKVHETTLEVYSGITTGITQTLRIRPFQDVYYATFKCNNAGPRRLTSDSEVLTEYVDRSIFIDG